LINGWNEEVINMIKLERKNFDSRIPLKKVEVGSLFIIPTDRSCLWIKGPVDSNNGLFKCYKIMENNISINFHYAGDLLVNTVEISKIEYYELEAMAPKEEEYTPINLGPLEKIKEDQARALSLSEYNQQLVGLRDEWESKFVYKKDPPPVIIKKAEESDYE
jgi:hypothetical protein